MEQGLSIAIKALSIIGTMWTVLHIYYVVVLVLGVFARKKYGKTDERHTYGICIAGRNEEKVICNLLESITVQDYPLDKLTVFVCADNCTDATAEKVREFAEAHQELKIELYEHKNPGERTKGYALRFLFERIKENHGIDAYEGYFVFDADNVLRNDYVSRMNESFSAGEKIIVSLRQSKNIYDNWISHSYASWWLYTAVGENRGKSLLRLSCRIQGTGFLFANELVKDGWNYVTLTEDRAFYANATVDGYVVAYNEDAVFYDEQPYKLKVALRQRVRWAKGHLQAGVEFCPKLLKNMWNSTLNMNFFRSYECFMTNAPRNIESSMRRILSYSLKIALGIVRTELFITVFGFPKGILFSILFGFLKKALIQWAKDFATGIYYRKTIPNYCWWKSLMLSSMSFSFQLIGKITTWIALFKHVEWKEIPHDRVMKINRNK